VDDYRKSIQRLISDVSGLRDSHKEAEQLGKDIDKTNSDRDLRNTISQDFHRLEQMLNNLNVSAGNRVEPNRNKPENTYLVFSIMLNFKAIFLIEMVIGLK
jgi:hypothetical protein